MIGLDTNVLLAWVLAGQARPLPAAKAYRISHVVLAELIWVLVRTMRYPRRSIVELVAGILEAADLVVDGTEVVKAAFEDFKNGKADFADFLIARDNLAAGCSVTVTMDKVAAREPNFTLFEQ